MAKPISDVFPVESRDSISIADGQLGRGGEGTQLCGDVGFDVCSKATSGWTIRVRINRLMSSI